MGRTLRGAKAPLDPDEMVRRLMSPAAEYMSRRAKLVLEAAGTTAANLALEQAAEICWLFIVDVPDDAPPLIQARLERQNKVASEIAERILSERRKLT